MKDGKLWDCMNEYRKIKEKNLTYEVHAGACMYVMDSLIIISKSVKSRGTGLDEWKENYVKGISRFGVKFLEARRAS